MKHILYILRISPIAILILKLVGLPFSWWWVLAPVGLFAAYILIPMLLMFTYFFLQMLFCAWFNVPTNKRLVVSWAPKEGY